MSIHPDFSSIARQLSAPIEGGPWGRLNGSWTEKVGGCSMAHKYVPVVNLETSEIYEDFSHLKIYAQMLAHNFVRPVQIACKTLYHLALPISLSHTLYVTIRDERARGKFEPVSGCYIAGKCVRNLIQCTLDIVRTPVYGTAMTMISLAALIYRPWSATQLYDFRATIAKIQRALYWDTGSVDSFDFFQPITLASQFDNENSLKRFIVITIDGRRDFYELFNNPFNKLGAFETYYSPGFEPITLPT